MSAGHGEGLSTWLRARGFPLDTIPDRGAPRGSDAWRAFWKLADECGQVIPDPDAPATSPSWHAWAAANGIGLEFPPLNETQPGRKPLARRIGELVREDDSWLLI